MIFLRRPWLMISALLLFACAARFGHAEPARANYTIWAPRGHDPLFAQPSDTVQIEVRAQKPLPLASWKAELRNDLRSWPASVAEVKRGRIRHNTQDGYVFSVKVPEKITPELLTLTLSNADAGTTESLRCLSIVPNPEQDFYILQATDEHVKAARAVRPDGKSHEVNGSVDMRNWAAPVINLINPRFMVCTGDNMGIYSEPRTWPGLDGAAAIVKRYRDSMAQYTVPTLLATGNHDIGYALYYASNAEWRKRYEDVMGERAFSRRIGSFYVLSNEWTQNEFFKWAQEDFDRSFFDPRIRYRLICQHYYEGISKPTTIPDPIFPCDLMIVGHNHKTDKLQTEPFPVYSAATAQVYCRVGFFDFHKQSDGWVSSQAQHRQADKDVFPLFGDWGKNPKVSKSFERPNDGTQQANRVSIVNEIGQDFYDGRVRFLMAKGDYDVKGGEILSQYDYDNGHTAVLVKVDIKPLAEVVIEIARKQR